MKGGSAVPKVITASSIRSMGISSSDSGEDESLFNSESAFVGADMARY